MNLKCEIKNSHYKKSRFEEKNIADKEMNSFNMTKVKIELEELIAINTKTTNTQFTKWKKNEILKFPQKNEVLSIRTQSQINTIDIILQIIKNENKIKFLSLQTYTFDKKTLALLFSLQETGKIDKLQIIMTESAVFRLPEIYKTLKLYKEKKNFNLCFYWVHSKVHMCQTENNKYIIDGSGNFSMNAQVEHYNIFNSEKLYNSETILNREFYFGKKLRKNHEIYKNFEI